MKKALTLSVFLISILFCSHVNATSFSLIDSYLHISGSIKAKDWSGPIVFSDNYDETANFPLLRSITYGSSFATSETTLEGIFAGHFAYGEENIHVDAAAETKLLFRPNFRGEGSTITFEMSAGGNTAWGQLYMEDLTTANMMISEEIWCYEHSRTILLAYSEWDPDHVYELTMSAYSGGNSTNDGSVRLRQDISFVPEPSTVLLLSSGLIVIAGYGRKKFFKR